MNTDQVDAMLHSYNACKARKGHLQNEISFAERRLEYIRKNAMYQEALGAQQYDGMPHASGISNPIENLIVKYDDGYTPKYIKEIRQDIDPLYNELFEIDMVISFVDSWMLALTEREAFVIRQHVIEGRFWKDVLDEYEAKWGLFSKEGLRKMKKKALNKIYEAAE